MHVGIFTICLHLICKAACTVKITMFCNNIVILPACSSLNFILNEHSCGIDLQHGQCYSIPVYNQNKATSRLDSSETKTSLPSILNLDSIFNFQLMTDGRQGLNDSSHRFKCQNEQENGQHPNYPLEYLANFHQNKESGELCRWKRNCRDSSGGRTLDSTGTKGESCRDSKVVKYCDMAVFRIGDGSSSRF